MANDTILESLVVEDLSGSLQLGTPGGWRPTFTGIAMSFDGGEVELAYPTLNGPDTLFSNPFAGPFLVGAKYFFGFWVFIERGTYFDNETLTNTNQTWNSPSSREAWQLVGATFDVPDPSKAVQFAVRFDVSDLRHRVFMKDFVLYQLADHSHYLRIQLIAPDRNPSPNVGTAQVSLNDQYEFTLGGFGAVSFTNVWSDWLELPGPLSIAPTATIFPGRFKFRDKETQIELLQVQSAFQVAVGPKGGHGDQAHALLYDVRSTPHGHFVLNLPGPSLSLLDLNQVRFLSDILGQDIANAEDALIPKALSPQQYWLGMFFPNSASDYDLSEDLNALYGLFRELGLNALDYGPALSETALSLDRGFTGAVYYFRVLGDSDIAQLVLSYKLPAIRDALLSKAIGWRGGIPNGNDIAALFKTTPDRVLINVNDEAGGLALAGPDYAAAFQNYLKSLNLNPTDFGVTDFSQLDALPRTPLPSNPSSVDGHIFYWRNRFWSEANAEVYRVYREATVANPQWGGSYHFTFNYGDVRNLPHTFHNGMEVLTFAKHGAVSIAWFGMGFTSTLVDYFGWAQGFPTTQQFMSLVADYALAVTRSAHIPVGTYLRTGEPTLRRLDYYLFNFAARGVTYFDYYGYGPSPPYDGIGGSGDATVGIFRQVAHGSDLLARSERFLFGASRHRARIALLAAQTESLWNPDGAGAAWYDEAGFHHAFTHGHHPVDYVFEEDIAAGVLNNGYAILYVNVVYLSGDAYQSIKNWVANGGTLILGQKGATHDEYAQAVASPWTGVAFDAAQSGAAQINWQGVNLTTLPGGSTRVVTGSGTTLATFSSGGAAAMEILNGSGRVVALGFDPGTTYLNVGKVSGGPFPGRFMTAFQIGMRSILLGLATDLGLDSARPISADNPLVEASRLDRADDGGAAVLLNYNNYPVQNLQVRIPGVHGWVQSQAQQTALSVKPDQTDPTIGVVELQLDDIDVLTWGSPSLS
jgi:hypothetical protein